MVVQQKYIDFGLNWAYFDQFSPNLGDLRQICGDFERILVKMGHNWSNLVDFEDFREVCTITKNSWNLTKNRVFWTKLAQNEHQMVRFKMKCIHLTHKTHIWVLDGHAS